MKTEAVTIAGVHTHTHTHTHTCSLINEKINIKNINKKIAIKPIKI